MSGKGEDAKTWRWENAWRFQGALNRAVYLEPNDEVRKTSETKLKN